MAKYNEYKRLNLPAINKEVNEFWQKEDIFKKSLAEKAGFPPFIFYEGPPSANGVPGIHHVMARAIKDTFCRYKTQKGFLVNRKAGWDTHGLPVEIAVEKKLGITKEDIGKKISIEDYNKECRKEVMKYTDLWDDLTKKMGYWVDLENPYITCENKYIETVWHLLSQLYNKGLLYKGYAIQPYSPAAGTGLSTHELNQPGAYKDVKDTTCTALFKVKKEQNKVKKCIWGFSDSPYIPDNLYIMAWTTTPWTLPSNTALAVGKNIDYVLVKTFNHYLGNEILVILAKNLLHAYFPEKNAELKFEDYKQGDKNVPFQVLAETKGENMLDLEYEQLIAWVNPGKTAFRLISGDYITTEDGTGIVHIAPTFGTDDARVAKAAGIPPLILLDKDRNQTPMVDKTGKFIKIEDILPEFLTNRVNVEKYSRYAGRFVKNAYMENAAEDTSLDIEIALMLKQQGLCFKIEKHTHNYPHCWRTDKPVLYYPLDSWFIKTTALKERMIELNKTINWKPESTGSGRFGNWLENLVDWNLSRSRYWGVPLPIWTSEDGCEQICIASVAQLKKEVEKSIAAGFMMENPFADFDENDFSKENYNQFDLHRPYADNVILVSDSGQKMFRETDLIDVWFDSGSMPYAQYHYPFECDMKGVYPADFIAEGVDQTRGWFFTLHAIATMLFDSIAYKNVVSNGLVLDKNGNKMSKRLGNAIDPFQIIEKYGADATRWYMLTNSSPWDNLKFDEEGIAEVQRKFFGTLYNSYSFFALYANIDGFTYKEEDVKFEDRPEIDRWILSELHSLIKNVDENYNDYEPTKAGRLIQAFVDAHLSNWFVRLSRRRFWKGDYSTDKISAYQTLYQCLGTITKLMAPIAPFFAEKIFKDLNDITNKENKISIHLTDFPKYNENFVDKVLEERMEMAQTISSMGLSLRKKYNIRVRQPLQRLMIPVLHLEMKIQIQKVENLIKNELNVKELEYITDTSFISKSIKANFKTLGKKYGKLMKQIADEIANFSQEEIAELESDKLRNIVIDGNNVEILMDDVEIATKDIPGWAIASEGSITVALDTNITEELQMEGIAREVVNRIQNLRKDLNFEVTDKIFVEIEKNFDVNDAIIKNKLYICNETLATNLEMVEKIAENANEVELLEGINVRIKISKQ
ncbi:MAG: isoleucine--tRNA ligase [Bacteroidales bacterium]|nr:isoleucine--tRNA ligase [Bacteroidales bacterium]